MGEIADAMIGGLLCQICGAAFDDRDEPGYARTCAACKREERKETQQTASGPKDKPFTGTSNGQTTIGLKFRSEPPSAVSKSMPRGAIICTGPAMFTAAMKMVEKAINRQLAAANEGAENGV